MFENDVLNNMLKPPFDSPRAFFYRGFNPKNEFEDWLFAYLAQCAFLGPK